MLETPATRFGRLTIVVMALTAAVAGTGHFLLSGGHGRPEGPNFWLREDSVDKGWIVEIVGGAPHQRQYPLLPVHCYRDVLPIFSTEPLALEWVPRARSSCPEGSTESFMDGRMIADQLVCRIEDRRPNADKWLPLWTEMQIIWSFVGTYSWSAINAWGPSFLVSLFSAAAAWLSLFVGRWLWFWVTEGR